MNNSCVKVMVKCPSCTRRIFDKCTPATGEIEIKCPRCGNVVRVNLALRRGIYYRRMCHAMR